jgi:hypothetical protein
VCRKQCIKELERIDLQIGRGGRVAARSGQERSTRSGLPDNSSDAWNHSSEVLGKGLGHTAHKQLQQTKDALSDSVRQCGMQTNSHTWRALTDLSFINLTLALTSAGVSARTSWVALPMMTWWWDNVVMIN